MKMEQNWQDILKFQSLITTVANVQSNSKLYHVTANRQQIRMALQRGLGLIWVLLGQGLVRVRVATLLGKF